MSFPWKHYKRFCLGILGWSPPDFWQSNIYDAMEAYEGYALHHGLKKEQKLPSDEARKALRARVEREKKERK